MANKDNTKRYENPYVPGTYQGTDLYDGGVQRPTHPK